MRPEVVVGAGAALLLGALAGIEWWAEHQWPKDAVVRPAADSAPGDPGVPVTIEIDDTEASASPRLSR
jgi:hypothetical protein